MGTWYWEGVHSITAPMEHAPSAALLAASICPGQLLDDDYEAFVGAKTRLPQLSLVEWSVSDMAPAIFPLLREAGSHVGYVVSQGAEYRPEGGFRTLALNSPTAEAIIRDSSMDMPMAFVDEHCRCALVSYHTDYALISMTTHLFDQWLKKAPLDLSMWSDDEPYPLANDLETAQQLSRRRKDSWSTRWSTS